MQAPEVLAHARPRLLSRREYDQMVNQGLFRGERVELIDGIVVEMTPIGADHSDPVAFLNRAFVVGVGDRATVLIQSPFAASDRSEPEPDVALVPPGRYHKDHPDTAYLLVEVAKTSLAHDRETKAPLYAASGVPEYWIVDLEARAVEVHDTPSGGVYTRIRRFGPDQSLAPAAFPDVEIAVGELILDPEK